MEKVAEEDEKTFLCLPLRKRLIRFDQDAATTRRQISEIHRPSATQRPPRNRFDLRRWFDCGPSQTQSHFRYISQEKNQTVFHQKICSIASTAAYSLCLICIRYDVEETTLPFEFYSNRSLLQSDLIQPTQRVHNTMPFFNFLLILSKSTHFFISFCIPDVKWPEGYITPLFKAQLPFMKQLNCLVALKRRVLISNLMIGIVK